MTEQEQAVREIGRRMVKEETRSAGFDTVFPAGTILTCADCGKGLHKVTQRATTADIVLYNGTILKPLNTTSPSHDAWKSLACIKCGDESTRVGRFTQCRKGGSESGCDFRSLAILTTVPWWQRCGEST